MSDSPPTMSTSAADHLVGKLRIGMTGTKLSRRVAQGLADHLNGARSLACL